MLNRQNKITKKLRMLTILSMMILTITLMSSCMSETGLNKESESSIQDNMIQSEETVVKNLFELQYNGSPWIEINGNVPEFSEKDKELKGGYEYYPELDNLERCGTAIACLGDETMPDEERGSIGMVKPSGWHTVRYDDIISDKYLYNRCHLIGFQLAGENANKKNLITGTRYLNVTGMLPFEDKVAEYIKKTGNHVLYRVTPVFEGNNLVAHGVQMEAYSIEDSGEGICFNVYCFNVQPGIEIDYATGDSKRSQKLSESSESKEKRKYVLNTNTGKFHLPECSSANQIKEINRLEIESSYDKMIESGYEPCGRCLK